MSAAVSNNATSSLLAPLPQNLNPFARKLYYIGPPALLVFTAFYDPRLTALLPLTFIPTLLTLRAYNRLDSSLRQEQQQQKDHPRPKSLANPTTLIYTYASSLIFGLPLAGVGQAILGYSFYYLFHGKDTLKYLADVLTTPSESVPEHVKAVRAVAAWTWREVLKRVWVAYVMTGGLEECLKAGLVVWAVRRGKTEQSSSSTPAGNPRRQHEPAKYAYLQYAVASGLGFATMESIVGAYGFVATTGAGRKGWGILALEFGERVVQGTAGHVLMTVLAGLRLYRSQEETQTTVRTSTSSSSKAGNDRKRRTPGTRFLRAVLPAALYHGSFNFALFSLSATSGHMNWVHPTDPTGLAVLVGTALGILGTLTWHVNSTWEGLRVEGDDDVSGNEVR